MVVRLTADVGQFQTGIGSATTSVQSFQNAVATATTGTRSFYEGVDQAGIFATGSERGIRRMEMALGGIAAQSVGANHSLGLLGESMLLFSGGSAVAIGVLAGLAAIAGALQLISANAEADEMSLKKLEKELDTLGPHAKMVSLQLQIADLERQKIDPTFLEKIKQLGKQFWGSLTGSEEATGTGISEAFNRQIATLQNELSRATEEYNTKLAHQNELLADERMRLFELGEELDRIAAKVAKEIASPEFQADLENLFDPGGAFFRSKAFQQDLKEAGKQMGEVLREGQRVMERALEETDRQMQRLGNTLGRDLAEAIGNGFKDMAGLLKSIFMQVLQFALGQFFGSVFKSLAGGGIPGAPDTSGFDPSSIGHSRAFSSGGVTIDMSRAMPLTAFAVARDPGFQEVIRAAILTAKSQGFRG